MVKKTSDRGTPEAEMEAALGPWFLYADAESILFNHVSGDKLMPRVEESS